jgi:hypothetical protein
MTNFTALLATTTDDGDEIMEMDETPAKTSAAVIVPKSLSLATQAAVLKSTSLSKGSLSESLAAERYSRQQSLLKNTNRFSKGSSTYRLPVKGYYSVEEQERVLAEQQEGSFAALLSSVPPSTSSVKTETVPLSGIQSSAPPPLPPLSQQGGGSQQVPNKPEFFGKVINSSAVILKNPFNGFSNSLPQAKTKRNKKNITYVKVSDLMEVFAFVLSF